MTAFVIPDAPGADVAHVGRGKTYYRYEDVAQDGRLRIEGVWPSMGRVLFGESNLRPALSRMAREHGIRSVLTRVVMRGGNEPISLREPALTEVRWQLEHALDDEGRVNRLLLNTWLETTAPKRESDNPVARGTDERVLAARAYGQHVFTKPLEKPPHHRVLELEDPELPAVPEAEGHWRPPEELLAVPDGAEPLEAAPSLDVAPVVFGLAHTDGNRHVNFLTYPRLVEDVALRRLASLGVTEPLLGRSAEVGYRKPCFAGERVRIACRAFRLGEDYGVAAAFLREDGLPESAEDFSGFGRASCTARVLLSR